MKPIVVVGSINMDLVSSTPRIPSAGETIIGTDFQMHSGGKGANQAVAVARLGYPSILLGAVGDDVFGDQLLKTLSDYGVETQSIRRVSGATGTASIVVDQAGENTIIVTPGANSEVTAEYLKEHAEVLRDAGIVLLQLEIPLRTVAWVTAFCAGNGVPVMLDPAPAARLNDDLLNGVTWFTPNETEADFYRVSGESSRDLSNRLFAAGVQSIIFKKGSGGVTIAAKGGGTHHADAFEVAAVDTTAAGDSFNGAFAVGLMKGFTVQQSARFAAAAAAVSVTRKGAQPSLPSWDEVVSLMGDSALFASVSGVDPAR